MTLFCPQGHLLLQRQQGEVLLLQTCPQCGWQAPAEREAAEVLWQVDLDAPLGGPSRRTFAHPAIYKGRMILPLANGEMVALRLGDGSLLWRRTVGAEHLLTRTMAVAADRVLALVLDQRTFGDEHAVAEIDPATGDWRPVFQPGGPLMGLVPWKEGVLVRTPQGIAYLTPAGDAWAARWLAEARFSALPPTASGPYVAALWMDVRTNAGQCVLWDASGHKVTEVDVPPLLTRAFASLRGAAANDTLIWSGERARGVWALDIPSGRTRWLKEMRVYTPPAVGGGAVWVVARGSAPQGQLGHYLLRGLDIATGKTIAEMPLPRRVLLPLEMYGDVVLLFDDGGVVQAVDPQTETTLWEVPVGGAEDPPGAHLLQEGGRLIAGTFLGRMTMLSLGKALAEALEDPAMLLEQGKPEAAALTWALQGNLRAAARVYAEVLQQPARALALLEADGAYAEALALAQQHGLWRDAERLAMMLNDLPARAQAREARGDLLAAARLWEQVGDRKARERAAHLYAQSGAPDEAWRVRKALGQIGWFRELLTNLGLRPRPEDWEAYATKVGLEETAQLAFERGYYRRAVEFYRRAANLEGERRALKAYLESESAAEEETRWAWERLAEVARRLGDFAEEARAWEAAREVGKAIQAYYRAAQAIEEKREGLTLKETRLLLEYYLRFLHLLGVKREALLTPELDALNDERIQKAREQVLMLQQLPRVEVAVKPKQPVFEDGYNVLWVNVVIKNTGYGTARNIKVSVDDNEGLFKVSNATRVIPALPTGAEAEWEVPLLLTQSVIGDAPVILRWWWHSEMGNEYGMQRSFPVPVRAVMPVLGKGEVNTLNIAIQNIGDSVNLYRDGQTKRWHERERRMVGRMSGLPSAATQRQVEGIFSCPFCGWEWTEKHLAFCPHCGASLSQEE